MPGHSFSSQRALDNKAVNDFYEFESAFRKKLQSDPKWRNYDSDHHELEDLRAALGTSRAHIVESRYKLSAMKEAITTGKFDHKMRDKLNWDEGRPKEVGSNYSSEYQRIIDQYDASLAEVQKRIEQRMHDFDQFKEERATN
ncbi:MAG: hypothetical protein AAFY56_20650, partial [Pseudomonadota bacterium]